MPDKKIIDKKNTKENNSNDDEEVLKNTEDPARDWDTNNKTNIRENKTGKTLSDKAARSHYPM